MATNSVSSNFSGIVLPGSFQTQRSLVQNGALTSQITPGATVCAPLILSQGTIILGAAVYGTTSVTSSYFNVSAWNANGLLGTVYGSLGGSGPGVSYGTLFGATLPADCWLTLAPTATLSASANIGLAVNYLSL